MTTMQEALADKYLTATEVPEFLSDVQDLMQRSYANPKYGNAGLALVDGTNASDSDGRRMGIPSKRQNKIRSGRAGRKAANSRAAMQRVGGIWDSRFPGLSAVKAIYADADKQLCRTESEHEKTGAKKRVAGTKKPTASAKAAPKTTSTKAPARSSLLAAVTVQFSHIAPNTKD